MWRVAVFVGAATLLWSAPVEVRTGSFDGKPFTYNVINGWAVFEGDILLGTADELDAGHHSGKQPDDAKRASVLPFQQNRWTNGVIPYAIDSDLPNPQRVLDAIQHWNDKTAIRLQPRSGEANWLRFFRSTTDLDCSSSVGMRGGEQRITVLDTCMTGALIHEIGHTVGL